MVFFSSVTICHVGEITNRGQKKVLDLELEFQTIGSCLMWVLWTELRSSRKTFQCTCRCVHTHRGQVNFRCYFSKIFRPFFLLNIHFLSYLFVVCAMCGGERKTFLRWFFFQHVVPEDKTQVIRLLPNTFIQWVILPHHQTLFLR